MNYELCDLLLACTADQSQMSDQGGLILHQIPHNTKLNSIQAYPGQTFNLMYITITQDVTRW